MKKISHNITILLLLLAAISIFPQTLWAQEQTPEIVLSVDYVEQDLEIPVSPNGGTATLHIISYGGIPEETLLSNIQSSLEALSINWITNVYLTNKEGIYEADLNFDFSSNNTDQARELIVSASNGSSLITQDIHLPNVYNLLPNVNPVRLLHGGTNALILSLSDGFASYRLLKDSLNYTKTIADVNGKSEGNRQLKFIINSLGTYYCIAYYPTEVQMNGTKTVEWHPFYDTTRSCSLSPIPYTFSKDGGSVSFTYAVPAQQDSILQRIIDFYNSGNCSVWDTTMVISYTRSPQTVNTVTMTVEAGPNLKEVQVYPPQPNTITNNTYFKTAPSGDDIVFTQPAAGEIKAYSVSFPGNPGTVPPYLILDSTQHRVRYVLFKDGTQYGPSRTGHGDSLHLTIPADSGKFTVMAFYGGENKAMKGTLTVTGNMKAVWGDNWILKQTFTAEGGESSNLDITYYDGLGYPTQVINVGASPQGKNIITPIWYDSMRRDDAKAYLPYASTTGSTPQPENNPLQTQNAFYANLYGNSDADYAFTEKVYENSPLNRVQRQFTPGEAFRATGTSSGGNDHYTAFTYEANSANEVMDMVCGESGELSVRGYIASGKLYKTTTTSPDGRVTTEFKDSDGTIFLQKIGTGNRIQETYYAYDSRRRLRWVIQPEGSLRIKSLAANSSSANPCTFSQTDSTAQEFCFIYNYNGKSQMTEKRIPGKGFEYMVYDPVGRLVATQDSVLRAQNRWILTRYDSLSRVAETCLFCDTSITTREQLQAQFNQNPHPASIYSASGNILLTCSRYGTSPPSSLNFANVTGVVTTHDCDSRTMGLLTYDKTLDLSSLSLPEAQRRYRERAYYYDHKARVIQTVEVMPEGEVTRNSTKYDFTGNPLAVAYTVSSGSNASLQTGTQTLWQTFTYDHRGRRLSSTSALNDTGYTFSAVNYGYDALGRLSESQRGKTSSNGSTILSPSTATPVLKDSLSYNIQGWMTSQTDKVLTGSSNQPYGLYSQSLGYHNPQKANTTPSFDGLITEWETIQGSDGADMTKPGSTQTASTYAFAYDSFGRLMESARYAGSNVTATNTYTERGLAFDSNGNILSLTRYGASAATSQDSLLYSYSGNRIRTLAGKHNSKDISHQAEGDTNAGTEDYRYDGNGNMTYDALRHIAMTYDINNLVSTVSRNDTILSNYTYLADGTKYKVMGVNDELGGNGFSSGRLYLGPLTYKLEPAGTVPSVTSDMFYLENADSECGRAVVLRRKTANGQSVTTNFTTLFSVSDHLGSSRAVMDAAGNILERNAYYPLGLQTDQGNAFPEISSSLTTLYPRYINSSSTRRDLYNGKEIQTIAGTDYLDYGFRQYDPMTGRWMAVDPKAEKYLTLTPYNYCDENPIRNTDIWGLFIDDYYDYLTGRYLGTDGSSTNNMRIIRADVFHNIVDKNGGQSVSEKATLGLQDPANSKIITVDYETINKDVLTIADGSFETKIENALYLVLDRDNAVLTSELSDNEDNTNNISHIKGDWAQSTKILRHGNNLIVIAHIHGHPSSTSELITISGVSDIDAVGAQQNSIPVYAVDAMKERKGRQVPIHRANPDGTKDNNIGYTCGKGDYEVFDIARDAMNRR